MSFKHIPNVAIGMFYFYSNRRHSVFIGDNFALLRYEIANDSRFKTILMLYYCITARGKLQDIVLIQNIIASKFEKVLLHLYPQHVRDNDHEDSLPNGLDAPRSHTAE